MGEDVVTKLRTLASRFRERDADAVQSFNDYGPHGIEANAKFTADRCRDLASVTIAAIEYIADHFDAQAREADNG